jgi:hypothetical protein
MAFPGLYPAILLGPNAQRRNEAGAFLKDIERQMDPVTTKEHLFEWATLPFTAWTWLAERLNALQQPRPLRIEHSVNTRSGRLLKKEQGQRRPCS